MGFCITEGGTLKKVAFIFPGQGAQYPGMGKDFYESFKEAKERFQEADDLLGMHLSKTSFEGPVESLTETKFAQAAIYVNSLALLAVLEKQLPNLKPFITGGLSLGEYSALVASKKMSFQKALKLLYSRSLFMQKACEETKGTMAACLGLSPEEVRDVVEGVEGAWIANYNCPGQIVISGTMAGVEKASDALKEKGAKRVLPLTVAGAFHSPLMKSAEEALKPELLKAEIVKSDILLAMNFPGKVIQDPEEIRNSLISQVTGSVRWEEDISSMEKEGVDLYLEIGCGKTLTGFNRKIKTEAPTLSLERVEDLEKLASQLEEMGI